MTNRRPRLLWRGRAVNDGETGQALIEVAVSLPLLLLILLGAVEFGRLAYMAIEVSDAAKAAAQYGAQNETFAEDSAGMTLAAQNSAPYVSSNCTNFTASAVHHGTTLPCTCITNGVASPSTATITACSATCSAPSYSVQVLQITTSATCTPLIHPLGFSGAGITLHGGAIQEVLN